MSINLKQYEGLKVGGLYWDAALLQAEADCNNLNQTLFIPDGVYHLQSGETQLTCSLVMEDNAKLIYNGAAVGLTLGKPDSVTHDRNFRVATIYRQSGYWHEGSIGADTGLRLLNLKECRLEVGRIEGFSIGISSEARTAGNGMQDVTIVGRSLWNNAISFRAIVDPGCWVSRTTVRDLKFHMGNSLGTRIPGTRHVQLLSPHKGYVFSDCNFEGNAAEYLIECAAKQAHFRDCYFEGTSHVNVLPGVESLLIDGRGYEEIQYEGALTISPVVYGNKVRATAS